MRLMFGRLTNVRIKAAEDACEQGRLDDAFDIVVSSDVAAQGRLKPLRERIADDYLRKGQDHMMDREFATARRCFARAAQLRPDDRRVGDWIMRADKAIADDQASSQQRDAALREARQRMEAGSLNGAAAALEHAGRNDVEGAALNNEIARRAEKAGRSLASARKAIDDDRLQSAVGHLLEARRLDARHEGLSDIESQLIQKCVRGATNALHEGRIDRAAAHVALLRELGADVAEPCDIDDAVALVHRAATALQRSAYDDADLLLARLATMAPGAAWIAEARDQIQSIDDNRRRLFAGPLGLAVSQPGAPTRPAAPMSDATLPAHPVPPPPPRRHVATPHGDFHDGRPDAGLPRRLLLRIDGVGSFLLIRGDRVSIGRAGPGASADIQLVSDLSERHAEIVRAGEDYFVVSQSGVELAGNATDHALMQNGDRIRLSRRVRLTFARPSLKSTAASLDLGEGVRMPSECRRIVLWSGPILMGATRECHIRLGSTLGDFILAERGGRLFFKAMRGDAGRHIALGEQVNAGELSLRVTDWNASTGARGTIVS